VTFIIDDAEKIFHFALSKTTLMSIFNPPAKFKTPVLLIVFNRPETTRVVFEAIRSARPPRLYVAADGPRPAKLADKETTAKVRQIVSEVDWPCDVKTLFRDVNLGCGKAVSSAISWFFSCEEEGIVLEDDCVPSKSFFWYCQELLERYRDDTRVMHIGGNNFIKDWDKKNTNSYYFSRNGHIWGWASWRRAWQAHDLKILKYQALKNSGYFENLFSNKLEKYYRLRKFNQILKGEIDTWDYQWDLARFINSGLSIVPAKNLVINNGFGEGATHTKNGNVEFGQMKANEIQFPLRHPPYVHCDFESDRKYFSSMLTERVMSKLQVA
jgi:hypothetical protein